MFKEFLQDLNRMRADYVVQRNWGELPQGDSDHPDLDLFVGTMDYAKVIHLVRGHDLQDYVDVRTFGDGYYPREIELALLSNSTTVEVAGVVIKIPNKWSYFLSLYYHNAVHKQGDPYGEELRRLFLENYPPVKCVDEGVGFYV